MSDIPNSVEVPRTRWTYLDNFLNKPGPATDEEWVPGAEAIKGLESSKVFLGSLMKADTIDVSNLNRQFLFREADVGKSKAEVAAAFVEKRVKGVKITPYNGKIQDKDEEYYMQFKVVVCGLDSVEARRWINATLIDMVDQDNFESMKPLIDGGTEGEPNQDINPSQQIANKTFQPGFKGQSRVILPTITSCIECQLEMHAPRAAVPLCTLATIPRQPAHCIEWAHIIAWSSERKDIILDTDDPEHINWLYQKALARAQEFNIQGVTYSMTQGVVKNIIPAIASTNAIIAASCCNEAFKIVTSTNPFLSNYMMYSGDEGIYTYTFETEQKPDCPVCGNLAKNITVYPSMTLQEFLDTLGERPEAQLKKPSIRTGTGTLYMRFPQSLEEQTRPNLAKKLGELVTDGEEVGVSDPAFQISFKFRLVFGV
ncbi:MAG: hypothetical protein Q9164_001604 [Protoblastenia rupestris]